jgi:hypothetical protein
MGLASGRPWVGVAESLWSIHSVGRGRIGN